ncbi:efflux RND transporter periplasmic adaptor subunit [Clostridium sp. CX1]|uniref:Efflux RND transporter periplasmic adaptor subunit n=1 Tax=Clostridium tanneri TaxID=3037988 RepID=A0ABU4JT04_9CLOT|nr:MULTISPECIES: efflux RND transporter periplasmic adaptor subunit [unclassified Clostridium]MCT8978131.1 efflux RND transporter periplasmic adaptor subunit [Clostridium sp. CX1]MDW8801255.1 efflux RND transporter periplasmic adaptor subunit [Clostridium sp. A1-XYC3]
MKIRKVTALLSLVIMAIFFTSCTKLTGDKIINNDNKTLTVQSNVSMESNNVNSQTGGQIETVFVKEGDTVKKGQVLVSVNSDSLAARKSQIQAQIETVTAQLSASQAARNVVDSQLQEAQNGSREEEINQAKITCDLAETNYNRTKQLFDSGYAAKEVLDNAQSQFEIAKNKYELLKKGTRPEAIARLQAQVEQASAAVNAVEGQLKQAQAALEELNVNMKNTTITAPADGVITELNVKSGDLVSSGMPLIVITNTNDPSIMCNVRETDISKVKLDQKVSIKIPGYKDKKFTGKVARINKNADFAVKRATNDNGEFDILSYGVKIQFDNLDVPLRAGMTAFVDFGK